MLTQLTGFLWFVLMLAPLIFLQRLLHRELQAVFLIATRSPRFTIGLFQLIFLPGVFLHELSHYLMAKILRVPTGRFSVLPRPLPDGRLQMGYVEIARSDIVRDSLIGAAPLIAGTLFVAYVAVYALDMRVLWDTLRNGQMSMFWMGMNALPTVNHFYWWSYLAFAVSSMMTPSQSDRHAWLGLVVSMVIIFGVALLIGAGPWILSNLAPRVSGFLSSVAVIFGLSAAIHGILVLPIMFLHLILTRLTGVDIK
jgi:hypothetical protein